MIVCQRSNRTVTAILLVLLISGISFGQVDQMDSTHIQKALDSLQASVKTPAVMLGFEELSKKSRKIGYKHGIAFSNIHIGNYAVESGEFEYALERYQEMAAIGSELKDTATLAKAYSSMGILFSELGEFDKALSQFDQAIELVVISGDEKLHYASVGNKALIYARQGDYPNALKYLEESKKGMLKLGYPDRAQTANYNIATIHNLEDNSQKAVPYIKEYLSIAKMNNDSASISYGYKIYGETYYKLKMKKEALLYIDSSIYMAEKMNLVRLMPDIYGVQSEIYEESGNPRMALVAQKKYAEAREKMINDNAKENLAKLEVQFETEKKEKELILREKEVIELTQSAKLNRQRLWMMSGGLLASLLIGLLFFLKLRSDSKRLATTEQLIRSELKVKELKTQQLQSQLKNKDADLTNLALEISRKNESSSQLIDKLVGLKKANPEEIKTGLRNLINYVSTNLQNNEELALLQQNIDRVNQEFYQKLEDQFGGLTPNDKYLAGLVRLNLSNKEVAALRGISAGSAKMGRHRLRKKLNLEPEIDIVSYLQNV